MFPSPFQYYYTEIRKSVENKVSLFSFFYQKLQDEACWNHVFITSTQHLIHIIHTYYTFINTQWKNIEISPSVSHCDVPILIIFTNELLGLITHWIAFSRSLILIKNTCIKMQNVNRARWHWQELLCWFNNQF